MRTLSPREQQIRDLREHKFALAEERMKRDQAKVSDRPKVAAVKKEPAKKKSAKKPTRKIDRTRG
jgi:hypothetical protein